MNTSKICETATRLKTLARISSYMNLSKQITNKLFFIAQLNHCQQIFFLWRTTWTRQYLFTIKTFKRYLLKMLKVKNKHRVIILPFLEGPSISTVSPISWNSLSSLMIKSFRAGFSLNHVHLSPAPFVNRYKVKTRFQFSSYISLTIYLMTIWLNKNTSIHLSRKYI